MKLQTLMKWFMQSDSRCVPAAGLGCKAKTEKSLLLPQTYSFPLMVLQISIASVYLLRRMNSRCEYGGCKTIVGLVDSENPYMEL